MASISRAHRSWSRNARTLYFANGYENAGQEVDFLSLRELVETIDVPPGREATWADFSAWYERMQGAFKLRETHKIYEEIKGVITGAAEGAPHLDEGGVPRPRRATVDLPWRRTAHLGLIRFRRPVIYGADSSPALLL